MGFIRFCWNQIIEHSSCFVFGRIESFIIITQYSCGIGMDESVVRVFFIIIFIELKWKISINSYCFAYRLLLFMLFVVSCELWLQWWWLLLGYTVINAHVSNKSLVFEFWKFIQIGNHNLSNQLAADARHTFHSARTANRIPNDENLFWW